MFSKSKRLGLVIILMAALVFMGINFLKAKKPQQWEWKVYIPGKLEGWDLYAYNAAGNPTGNLFIETEKNPIFVRVERFRRVLNSFRLCIKKDRYNLEKIGFKDLDLELSDLETSGKCPCSFPNYGLCPGVGKEDIPYCMKYFLENYRHPYTDPDDEGYDYETFWLSVDVDCNIERMNPGKVFPSGNVHIEIHKTDSVLPTGSEDYHTIVVGRDVDEGSGIITITKDSDNSWTIIVDTTVDTENDTIHFTEAYWDYWGTGKGKFVTKKPIRAIAPFKFITTWTRYHPK